MSCLRAVGFCIIFDRIYLLQNYRNDMCEIVISKNSEKPPTLSWRFIFSPYVIKWYFDRKLFQQYLTANTACTISERKILRKCQKQNQIPCCKSIGQSFVFAPGSVFLFCHPVNIYLRLHSVREGREHKIYIVVKMFNIYLVTLRLFRVLTHNDPEEKYYLRYRFPSEILRKY